MDTKSVLKSKTVWGIVVAVLPTVLTMLGIPLPPAVAEIIIAAGSSLGIYGRVTATERIRFGLK
jgi:hypothetical protein